MLVGCTRPRHEGNIEIVVIRLILQIQMAETQYHQAFARYGLLPELRSLKPNPITPRIETEALDHYQFELNVTAKSFMIRAYPKRWLIDGRRSFYSNDSMVIRQSWTEEPASEFSQELK
jgi:hypothetical protein